MNQGRSLFKKPYVVPFLSSCVVMSGLFFLGNGMGIWFTDLRNRRIDKDLELYTICANMGRFKKFYSEVDGCQVTLQSFHDSMLLGATYLIMFTGVALLLGNVSPKIIIVALQILCFPLGGVLPWITHESATAVIFIIFLAIPNCLIALVSGIVIEFTSVDLRDSTFKRKGLQKMFKVQFYNCEGMLIISERRQDSGLEEHPQT
uniref:Uncharacterized protein n=1 Tax=Glossina pallidipes TaxID=7398 RepID=A0A1A9ZK75_GLOPL